MGLLKNKTAVVTGGNSGLGLAAARKLREQGARVIITASSQASWEKATSEHGKEFQVLRVDVTKVSEIREFAKELGKITDKIDILFANSGISTIRPIAEFDEEAYDRVFDTNTKGMFFTVQQLSPFLNDGASVILNASMAASIGFAGGSVYGATKAAVRSFARMWAVEFAERRIRVNAISPSLIDTGIIEKVGLTKKEEIDSFLAVASRNPAGRIGQPDEVANAVVFLASQEASYINGIELVIDGGGTINF